MQTINFIIEHCLRTNQFVGSIPEVAGAHSQGESIDSLLGNLKEVCQLLELSDVQLVGKYDGSTYLIQV